MYKLWRRYDRPICVYFDREDIEVKDLVWSTINGSKPWESGVWNVIRDWKIKKYIYWEMKETEDEMRFEMYTISKEKAKEIEWENF